MSQLTVRKKRNFGAITQRTCPFLHNIAFNQLHNYSITQVVDDELLRTGRLWKYFYSNI